MEAHVHVKSYFFAKKIMKYEPQRLTSQPNHGSISSLMHSRPLRRLGGVVWVGFDGVQSNKVNEMKIFRFGRVGDGNRNFKATRCVNRDLLFSRSRRWVMVEERLQSGERSNSHGCQRIRLRISRCHAWWRVEVT